MKQHENINLLFFLTLILETVLNSLVGKFKHSAKYSFQKVINLVKKLNKTLQNNMTESAENTYIEVSKIIGGLINASMNHFNNDKLDEFIEHCNKFNYEPKQDT